MVDVEAIIENRDYAWDVAELAALLNESPKTLYRHIKEGRLPAFRIGKSVRINPSIVAEWFRKNKM